MLIKQIDEIILDDWDAFCVNNSNASFRHSSQGMRYYKACAPRSSVKNCSFALFVDNKIVAIAPIFKVPIESSPHLSQLSLGQYSAPFPVIADYAQHNSTKLMKAIFDQIDAIAQAEQVAYAHMCCEVLSDDILTSKQKFNPLLKFGFHEASVSSNVMPLNESEELLFKRLSKGHRADVKFIKKKGFTVDIIDHHAYQPDAIQHYKQLHESSAGGPTGQAERWLVWDDFIRAGYTTLALLREINMDHYIAGGLFITYKNKGTYGSGAIHQTVSGHRGLGHFIQWKVIKHLKHQGFTHLEIGINVYPVLSKELSTPKLLNISHFKSQFGADVFPLFMGEKFYSKEYLYAKRQKQMDEYVTQHAAFFKKSDEVIHEDLI